ncbi:DUF6284 family protein [Cryptosporangium sp. NPDC051539]|uniref:DUF6284 family protein n=1 Tax=Cryptosporangium sp. NPDC051539 TaxID=3363962 RepID=UPI0037BCF642
MGIVPLHRSSGEDGEREPSTTELAAIEAEWPEIEADLAVVDAEIAMFASDRGPSLLDWRRLRRAERRALAVRDLAGRPVSDEAPGVA